MSSTEIVWEDDRKSAYIKGQNKSRKKKSEETDDTELLIDITDIQKKILGYILRNIAHS